MRGKGSGSFANRIIERETGVLSMVIGKTSMDFDFLIASAVPRGSRV